jgi:ubiquinone biosynthesis protein UbiJ
MAVDPALQAAVLAALERAANSALALSPHSAAELAALDETVIAIECTAPAFTVFVQPTRAGELRLMGHCDDRAATRVRGSSSDFVELANAEDPAATLINGGLELSGGSAPLIALQGVIARLDVDWEAPLVDALGDVAGHQLAQLLRGLFSWGRQAGSSMTRQLDEFIHEEARLTPPRAEVEDFYSDLHALSLRVDRLQGRIERARARAGRLRERRGH